MSSEESKENLTFGHQDSLPSLPLPDLSETLRKYLRSVRPFLTEQELEHTEAVTKDFEAGAGKELHAMLAERAATERNWLEDWWETFAYLRPRYPIAINVNWHGVLPGAWGRTVTQPEAAASLTYAVLEFRRALMEGTLPAETMAGQKLCMNQFTRMFSSCRIPHAGMDEIEVHEGARHVLVLRNNSMFAVPVLDERGEILPAASIQSAYEHVVDETASLFNLRSEEAVSVLTAEDRDTWAELREHMISLDPANRENFHLIESAIFTLVLAQESPTDHEEVARLSLHGDGRNKYFCKPFNLIVFENGRMGLNGEHTWADAIAVVSLFSDVLKRVSDPTGPARATRVREHGPGAAAAVAAPPTPAKLRWVLDTKTVQAIERASTNLLKMIKTVDLRTLVFNHYGKTFIKRYNLIPDFFVQMAIQLAYFKLFRKPTAVYESGHTRLFYHGRTETVRSCHEESVAFCRAMLDPATTAGDRFNALKAAVKRQKELVKDALLGQGIDRHLMGMYILSEMEERRPRPAFFTDKAYVESGTFRLSTSNIGSTPVWGGFMTICEDGFGVCYGIQEDKINVSISASNNCPTTCAAAFRSALEEALVEMQELCLTREVIYQANPKL